MIVLPASWQAYSTFFIFISASRPPHLRLFIPVLLDVCMYVVDCSAKCARILFSFSFLQSITAGIPQLLLRAVCNITDPIHLTKGLIMRYSSTLRCQPPRPANLIHVKSLRALACLFPLTSNSESSSFCHSRPNWSSRSP